MVTIKWKRSGYKYENKSQLTSLSSAADSYISLYYRLPISFFFNSSQVATNRRIHGCDWQNAPWEAFLLLSPLTVVGQEPFVTARLLLLSYTYHFITFLSIFMWQQNKKQKCAKHQEAPGGVSLNSLRGRQSSLMPGMTG